MIKRGVYYHMVSKVATSDTYTTIHYRIARGAIEGSLVLLYGVIRFDPTWSGIKLHRSIRWNLASDLVRHRLR